MLGGTLRGRQILSAGILGDYVNVGGGGIVCQGGVRIGHIDPSYREGDLPVLSRLLSSQRS